MESNLLTPHVFYILLSLSTKERHGYEIMKQVVSDSNNKIHLGPGTLYGAIKRLIADGLITESNERPVAELDDERRKYYRITEEGKKALSVELNRYKTALNIAHERKLVI